MADVKSLVKALKDMAVTQYGKGAPYRNALASALKGDMGGLQELNQPSPVMPNEALDVAMTFAPMGITAYHGSPYKFDKFDPAKIGTGEGAQAYGHGLYFAENPQVAKSYQDALGTQKTSISQMASDNLSNYNIAPSNIKNLYQVATDKTIPIERAATVIKNANISLRSAPDEVLKNLISDFREQSKGALYTVDIADKAIPKMLDWDKPLSQQNSIVKKAWTNFTKENPQYLNAKLTGGQYKNPTGQDFHNAIFEESPSMGIESRKLAADFLKKQGLTGIRYLDQGSRGVEKGTNNYVVFDPNTVKILERN
jgi:hypothetical protein